MNGLIDVLDPLYTAIGEMAGPGVVAVDASKHPSYLLLIRRMPSHDVRLLHIVRDPRGVAHSWAKSVRRPESASGDDMEQLGTPAGGGAVGEPQRALHPGRLGCAASSPALRTLRRRPHRTVARSGRADRRSAHAATGVSTATAST